MKAAPTIGLLLVCAAIASGQWRENAATDTLVVRRMTMRGIEFSPLPSSPLLPSSDGLEELRKRDPAAALRYLLVVQPLEHPPPYDPVPTVASSLWIVKKEDEDVKAVRAFLKKLQRHAAIVLAIIHLHKYGLSR